MKITIMEIEASAEDLMANRSVADTLMDALLRFCRWRWQAPHRTEMTGGRKMYEH